MKWNDDALSYEIIFEPSSMYLLACLSYMSESVQNNMEVHVEDNLEQGQGSGDQASCQEPQ